MDAMRTAGSDQSASFWSGCGQERHDEADKLVGKVEGAEPNRPFLAVQFAKNIGAVLGCRICPKTRIHWALGEHPCKRV
eukprot:2778909-Amphidinium_carterae.1